MASFRSHHSIAPLAQDNVLANPSRPYQNYEFINHDHPLQQCLAPPPISSSHHTQGGVRNDKLLTHSLNTRPLTLQPYLHGASYPERNIHLPCTRSQYSAQTRATSCPQSSSHYYDSLHHQTDCICPSKPFDHFCPLSLHWPLHPHSRILPSTLSFTLPPSSSAAKRATTSSIYTSHYPGHTHFITHSRTITASTTPPKLSMMQITDG